MRVRSQPEGAIGVTLFYMTADLENNDMVIHSVVAPTSNKETETNFAYIATKENIWLSLVNDTAAAQSYTILFRDETGREACRSTGILAAQEQLFEKVSRILPCSVGIAGLVQANSRTGLAANLYLEGEKTAFLVQSGLQAVR